MAGFIEASTGAEFKSALADLKPAPPLPVPDSAWERVVLALERSLKYAPGALQERLRVLLSTQNLIVLAAILGAWLGAQFIPVVGELADLLLGVLGYMQLLGDAANIAGAVKQAIEARTSEQLEDAARNLGQAYSDTLIDTLEMLLLSRVMETLKAKILPQWKGGGRAQPPRPRSENTRPRDSAESGRTERTGEESTREGEERTGEERTEERPRTETEPRVDLVTGGGVNYIAQHAPSFPWGPALGVTVGVAVVGGFAYWLATRRRSPRSRLTRE